MKKSKMHISKSGNNTRISFSKRKEIQEMPNLIEVQSESYIWFYTKGIAEVLKEMSPIEDPTGN
ncbi:MAG: hypothetical protein MJ151_04580, partial [Lachnospiraceae bacterium]|nr:hypothetical protein [Lachnospiraceae bacterium]